MPKREQVWAITMVRDEADIIGYTVKHFLSQDIDGIVIADNMSKDGTRRVIESIDAAIPVLVVDDPKLAYYQGRKMTALAQFVHEKFDASWIVPFDADELWYSRRGRLLGAALRACSNVIRAIHVDRWNHLPTTADRDHEPNPFLRMQYRERMPIKRKVAFRHDPEIIIGQGNHGLRRAGKKVNLRQVGIEIRHFPWRSFQQMISKVRNGCEAYAAAPELDGMAGHWKRLGDILNSKGESGLLPEWNELFTCVPSLIHNPAPYCKGVAA